MSSGLSNRLKVEKWIWTEEDFEQMMWHDVRIHAMSAYEILIDEKLQLHGGLGELLFDIDYILKWDLGPDKHYQFWVSPATLSFQNVWDLKTRTSSTHGNDPTWDIWDIHRDLLDKSVMGKAKAWSWKIELDGGLIEFFATGFKQYLRSEPALLSDQTLQLQRKRWRIVLYEDSLSRRLLPQNNPSEQITSRYRAIQVAL